VSDMIRLNDINMGQDVNRAMQLRAKIAGIACPDAVIDTDNWPMANRKSWRRYLPLQAELGVPSLYYATHIDTTLEPLTSRDYELIRQVWVSYRYRVSHPDKQAHPLDRFKRTLRGMRMSPKGNKRRGKALGL
jgi:hypothetical protein